MNDTTSFAIAFAAVAVLLAGYLAHLERRAQRLEAELATIEAATATQKNRPRHGDS